MESFLKLRYKYYDPTYRNSATKNNIFDEWKLCSDNNKDKEAIKGYFQLLKSYYDMLDKAYDENDEYEEYEEYDTEEL